MFTMIAYSKISDESPLSPVAHVNVRKPVNAPVFCCMHVSTSISDRVSRADAQPCPDVRAPVCPAP